MARLKEKYLKEIIPQLKQTLKKENVMALPKLERVVVNFGIGKNKDDKAFVENTKRDISLITGQKPKLGLAKKAISNFKIRQGDVVGVFTTLRGDKMWAFLDKLFNIVLPRVRDFKGLSKKSFDGGGNYSIGIKEHTVFPEVNPNTVDKIRSLEVTIVTSAKDNESAYALMDALGLPFEKEKVEKEKGK